MKKELLELNKEYNKPVVISKYDSQTIASIVPLEILYGFAFCYRNLTQKYLLFELWF